MADFDYELKEDVIINPLPNVILVCNMEYGEKILSSGIIIPDDNGKTSGIKSRTCTVYAVGKNIDYLKPGEKILVSHGRWTRGIKVKEPDGGSTVIRRVDPKDILTSYD